MKKVNYLKGYYGLGAAFLIIVNLVIMTSSAKAEVIPSSRRLSWQGNVGVLGDIPIRTQQVDCTQTPYSVPKDGISDSANAIKSCLNGIAVGQVAYLPAGTYIIKSDIVVPSNKTLRGAGMGISIIKGGTPYSATWGLVGFNQNDSLGSSINIANDLTKESKSITTITPHGLQPGDYIIIDQLDNPSGDPPVDNIGDEGVCTWCGRASGRSLGQGNKVATVVNSTAFTVETPLYWNYSSSLTPQITKQNGMTVNAGVEDLTINNSVSLYDRVAVINRAANSWLLRVEIVHTKYTGILLVGYRNTIRSCKLHDTSLPLGPSSGYGIWMQNYASANLIEDNIIYATSNPIIINGETSGNVIAYNYLEAHSGNTGRQNGAFSSHGAHPMMNLIEGNYITGVVALDYTWGSSSNYTFYRNRVQLQTPTSAYNQYKFMLDFSKRNRYQNVVGNVLWTPGLAGTYECNSGSLNIDSSACLYALGYTSTGSPTAVDPAVATTLYRHGNYDYITNSIQWDSGNSDHILPASLYLSSKPRWFGGCTWPPVNPVGAVVVDLPAKMRYEGKSCLPAKIPNAPILKN